MKKFLSFVCLSALFTGAVIAQTQYNATTYHQFNTNYGYIQVGAQNTSWAHIYSDRPNFIFNKPVYSMNGFLSYNSNLNLEAASSYYVQIQPRSSSYGLILREYNSSDYGNIEVTSEGLGFGYNTSGSNLTISSVGNVKIQKNVYLDAGSSFVIGPSMNVGTDRLRLTHNGSDAYIDYTENLYFRYDGTTYDIYFDKNGKIQAKEILVARVETDKIKSKELTLDVENVADYVFADDYNLRSLNEVEQFVKENNHLPGMPKGTDLEKEGMNVAEMNNLLLEKIEELTLYIIEQKKEIEQLKADNENIKILINK